MRAGHGNVILGSLSSLVRHALTDGLLAPTDLNRWPPPDRCAQWRSPLQGWETHRQTVASMLDWLRDDLWIIRQPVDFPPEARSGLTINGLWGVQGRRLRQ